MGACVRVPRRRHVSRPIPRYARTFLSELSISDTPVCEDQVLTGLAHRLTEAIGATNIPSVREQLGYLAAQTSMVNAMMAGMEAEGSMRGEWYVPNKHFMYSAQVLTQDLYPRIVNTLRDLSGGALIMLPSSIHDFADPHIKRIIEVTQRAAKMASEEKVKFLKAAWDAIGSRVRLAPHTIRDVLRRRAFRHQWS